MTSRDDHDGATPGRGLCRIRAGRAWWAVGGVGDLRRLPAPVRDIEGWQLRGACRGLDSGLFFHPAREHGPARAQREDRAKQVCQICPVITACRRHALAVGEPYGVWGGLSEVERDELTGRGRPPVAAPAVRARPDEALDTPVPVRDIPAGPGHRQPGPGGVGVIELAGRRTAEGRPLARCGDVTAVARVRPGDLGITTTSAVRAAEGWVVAGGVSRDAVALTLISGGREEPQQLLTVVEVAAMLRVSRATVYRLLHTGQLPGKRVGKSLRVSREAAEKYLRDAELGGPDT